MRIGIDLGGTKIEGIALSNDGSELARRRVPTPKEYGETIDAIAATVAELESATAMRGSVGIGIPGVVVPSTGLVKNANSTRLNGRPLHRDLETRLSRPVRMMNDANCFAISEAADGAAAGAGVVFGVILGTGVGGGIVVHGRCLDGVNLIAGEWGHNALPWATVDELPGPVCYCGRAGCIEAWISGPGLQADDALVTGRSRTTHDIVALAGRGDPDARASLTRYRERVARSLSSVINLLDPDVIVLGGGMSNIANLADDVAALLPRWVFSDTIETRVVRNVHGDSSGVRGAAWLWPAPSA